MNYSNDYIYKLATKWAPINYQYIDLRSWFNKKYMKQDLIVPVNLEYYKQNSVDPETSYDTSNIRNRLKNIEIESLTPVAYYSFAATTNHFYLLYSFYHADDTSHPNDMEGCLIILERDGEEQKLLGMITIAHGLRHKYAYAEKLSLNTKTRNKKASKMYVETEDGHIHPIIQQESGKHGLYGLGHPWILTKIWRWFKDIFWQRSNIIVYYPYLPTFADHTQDLMEEKKKLKKAAKYCFHDLSDFKNTTHYATFYFDLIDILDKDNDGLIHRRTVDKNTTFLKNGKFHGNVARPPWLWKHDGIFLWDDPALLAEKWFVPNDGGKPFRDEQSPPTGKIKYERTMNGDTG